MAFWKQMMKYHNPLAKPEDVRNFIMEGPGRVSFPAGRMRLESTHQLKEGENPQVANLVFWCPEVYPDDIWISWDFIPLEEPGLAIMFFAAVGQNGKDLFDPSLVSRNGPYKQYHHGDIHALHVSYFRRKAASERGFHLCNLRKSYGFHMVAQAPDPLPSCADVCGVYRLSILKKGPMVRFSMRGPTENCPDLVLFEWIDDGVSYGPVLGGGRIGFRQMAPLVAEYANLCVEEV